MENACWKVGVFKLRRHRVSTLYTPEEHCKLKKSNLGGIDMFYLGVYSLGIFMLALIGMVTNKDVSRNMRFYGSLVFVPGVVYVLLTVISRSW